MARTLDIAPDELGKRRDRKEYFYPAARVDFQVSFENYDRENPAQPKAFPAVPRSLTINRNSYKEADTFQVTFDARAFPCTPESIRAGAVDIRLFQTEGNIEQGIDAATLSNLSVDPIITGLFDDVDIEYSDSGREVNISGTDYTALFTGTPWPKERRVDGNASLNIVLVELMEKVQGASNMRLVVEPASLVGTLPVVGFADGKINRKQVKVPGENYWDIMYGLAVRYGYILFVRNLEIVLTTPKAYIENRTQTRSFAWGHNITSLRVTRSMGKERVPQIVVSSYDDAKRKKLVSKFPKNRVQAAALGIGFSRDEVKNFTLTGIKDKGILDRAAETYYNLVARGEQKVFIATKDLKDLDGEDLLDISAGDSITLSFRPLSLDLLETMPAPERISTLVGLGYPQEVATVISEAIEKTNIFRRPLRVKEVTYEWGVDSGISISMELQNFVNVDLTESPA